MPYCMMLMFPSSYIIHIRAEAKAGLSSHVLGFNVKGCPSMQSNGLDESQKLLFHLMTYDWIFTLALVGRRYLNTPTLFFSGTKQGDAKLCSTCITLSLINFDTFRKYFKICSSQLMSPVQVKLPHLQKGLK